MARLEPFEPRPFLALAVSGGADSLALALLARDWARERGGSVLALVVDHGLRPESAAEAATTVERLHSRGIPCRLLALSGLHPGPAMADRAREARYGALVHACAEAGSLHLLLGHHRDDQAETVMIRALGNSRSAGLAAMPALREGAAVRLLRPLLDVPGAELRTFLRADGIEWVEDPSNRNPLALRARLRMPQPPSADLAEASFAAGWARAGAELQAARIVAERVSLHPEGFAVLSPGRIAPDALGALLQTIAGSPFPPPAAATETLAAAPGPATLAGVRLLPAGRFGPGWLVVREVAAMETSVPATPGAIWDRRFRLLDEVSPGASLGPLGADGTRFRTRAGLPAAIIRTLPAIRCGIGLVAVPHLGYARADCARARVLFCPPRPMAGAAFRPAASA